MSSVAASSSISGPIAVGSLRRPWLAQTSVAALISVGIALYFWIDSRYPALLKKMHSGNVAGASPSTVLAAMISSPMLNVMVLAMAFTLFPLPIALARLAVPLILLALVPLIVRKTAPPAASHCAVNQQSGWFQPVGPTVNTYLKNLGRLPCRQCRSWWSLPFWEL